MCIRDSDGADEEEEEEEDDALRWVELILFKEFVVGIRKFGLGMNGLGFDNGVFFIELTLDLSLIQI